jgi:hypothetical protein
MPGALLVALVLVPAAHAQQWLNPDANAEANRSIFRLIDELPAPNQYRSGSGVPGPAYWQQKADYVIRASLDTVTHRITGTERITYHNNAPEALPFLWVQLDQNVDSRDHSRTNYAQQAAPETVSRQARAFVEQADFEGGYDIRRVQLVQGTRLVDASYRINGTVMRIDLPTPLRTGQNVQFEIDWAFELPPNGASNNGRGVREQVRDGVLYEVAQWFPRMSVYDDVNGWQTDQFYGQGEFYLTFGDYDVSLTVPWNHIVDATGIIQNPTETYTAVQRQRLAQAYRGEEPTFIIRADEVGTAASRPKTSGTITWRFKAENVRDFAWVSSRTYVMDAAGYRYPQEPGRTIQIHSLYPREAIPLWDKVSTRATLQTLKTYGRMAFRYPYPKATNVHGPVFGMEYPMIAFCGARPAPDGSYTPALERALIGVTIHEVGHNWYPMIVASDERKWTWMDEGLNSFLQFYGEDDYARTYNGAQWTQTTDGTWPDQFQRGPAKNLTAYMRDPDQVPIMTESDLIHRQFGNNGYAKPATALVMLREKILGPEAFDQAFQYYSQAWMFKHPQPADFFRAMNNGAGENLNWFWRGFFFTTHANNQAIASVTTSPRDSITTRRDVGGTYYRVRVENKGGLVMPLEMAVHYADGTRERFNMKADIWRRNERVFTKGFFADKEVVAVVLDPDEAYIDVDRNDNTWTAPTATDAQLSAAGVARPVSAEQLQRLTGTYEMQQGGARLMVTLENGRPVLVAPSGGKFMLDVISPTQLRAADVNINLTFNANGQGQIEAIQATGAQQFTARRVGGTP